MFKFKKERDLIFIEKDGVRFGFIFLKNGFFDVISSRLGMIGKYKYIESAKSAIRKRAKERHI